MTPEGQTTPDGPFVPQRLPADEWSRWWGLRFRLRERLALSLTLVPMAYIFGALALAQVIPEIEGQDDLLRLGIDADTARTILSAVAGGMIAFTGLVVSIAILVVQFGASQYTPRLVNRFRRDPRVKHSLGIFIAPAIFALVSMRVIGENRATVVPSLTMLVNMGLLIAAVIAFFLLVAGLLDLLRPRRVIAQVVGQGRQAISAMYPARLGEAAAPLPAPAPDLPVTLTLRHDGAPGVLSAIDRGRLVRAATAADVVVEVAVGVGSYVPSGGVLFRIHGASDRLDAHEVHRAAILAEERTIAQDPAFAIRAIVDTALRALSPAVNDPTTAVQALDGLESLLMDLAGRDLRGRGAVADSHGHLRLVHPLPTWPELLDLSLTEIRHYGADAPQIPRRMRAILEDLLADTPEERHAELRAHLARLDSAIDRAYADPVERAHARQADPLGIGTRALPVEAH